MIRYYVIHRLGGPYWEKLCPRSCESTARGRSGTQTECTVSPNTDRPGPVNIIFIYFPTENGDNRLLEKLFVLFIQD